MLLEAIWHYVNDRGFIYQVVATLASYSVLRTILFYRTRSRRFKLFRFYGIPGPKPRLLDGNLGTFQGHPDAGEVWDELYKNYGETFGIYIGDEPSVVTTNLDYLRKLFFESTSSFKERTHVFLKISLSHSILFSKHDRWKLMRKVMSPPFSSYTMRGETSTQFVEESVRLMMEYIENKFVSQKTSIEIDIQDLMKSTALHMIANLAVMLPQVQVKENEQHVKSLDAFLSQSDKGVLNLGIMFPAFMRVLSFVADKFEHGRVLSLIKRRLNQVIDDYTSQFEQGSLKHQSNNKEQSSLMDILLELYAKKKITREELLGNADAILMAGYDTTSTTLTYIFWVLGKYPEVQEKLRQDLIAHGTDSKYLEQVMNETMRLYPTVISFITRLATETVSVDSLTIPQGARIMYVSWLIYRNAKYWPDPLKFDPERFREGTQMHPCAFVPFGMNERKCLGYQLAKLEMQMIVCDILLKYRIKTKSPEDLKLISYSAVLTKPKEKVLIELEKLTTREFHL